jgi:DNA-binding LacI/PurR family transcriptional regulator
MKQIRTGRLPSHRGITLEELAKRVKLTKGTVSAVLNDSPAAKAIPQSTKERIFAAAKKFSYRPNFFARTLVKKRTFTIGVITEEIGDAYGGMVISGIEAFLTHHKYFFLVVAHRHDPEKLERYEDILLSRGVEGLITVDTQLTRSSPLPTVAVAGHQEITGVTNVVLDQRRAAQAALKHLAGLGHREIAVMRGWPFSSDSTERWLSICAAAEEFGTPILPELTVQLMDNDTSPEIGYRMTKELLRRSRSFTALFAYNDICAIGAVRAVREMGLDVPKDISVVGFDDIPAAAYHVPSLTTVRQPLARMGEIAAQTLVERLEGGKDYQKQIAVEPELMIRESTGIACAFPRAARRKISA